MASLEEILNLLWKITGIDEVLVDPDLRLYDLQILDSMQTVDLLVALSDNFGVEIALADFDREQWATPRKFVDDIRGRSAMATEPRC
jgi:D-alanine--poly(phosphoribitol) ligase subunit 2